MQGLANFSPMMCERAQELIHLQLDGEIDAHDQTLLQHHLQSCASCDQSLHLYARVKEALSADRDVRAPARLALKIRRQRRWSRFRPMIMALGALCLLFGGLALLLWPAPKSSENFLQQAGEIHALNLPVDVASKNTQRLSEALKSVGTVQVPVIEGFDLKGVRILQAGRKAQLVYRDPLGKRLSIVVGQGKTPTRTVPISQGVIRKGLRYVKVGPLNDKRFVALFQK